ncbi:hypothetical protein PRIPAC_84764 [Pristionchus pacificus]|uniref:Uncharacterized protein n=1 Tax=Pristionchus pacificus TaxID=54126 RepID=A0A2A6BU25_PRIPA|nr:hypothetical protein PRIPAC_84764 [Pristionchus pacificus]|eukprot:PDM69405.1 hypothetical protein PRIPAC_44501 [Pristionchus pacificus]
MGGLHPCPDGVLRPGYVAPYYPYLFPRPYLAGIFVDYFQTLARYLGCEQLEFRHFPVDNSVCSPEECVNLLDGTIESGETFTYAVSTYLQYKDVFRYAYTVPAVMQEKIIFIEGCPADDIFTDTRLVFYTVYTYGALLAILLVIFLSIVVHYTRKTIARADPIGARTVGDFLGSFLLVIGTSLLIIIWNAAYNGNNTVTSGPRELTIPQLLRQVQNGMRTMLLGNSTTFYEGDEELLFGNGNYTFLDNINERLEYICTNPEIVSMFYTPESYRFTQLSNINRECRLQKIQPGRQHLPTAWLDKSVRTGDNFNFPLAKNTSRSTIEKMNWLLFTVYNSDNASLTLFQQATVHLRRTILKVEIALTNTMTPPIIDGRSFSLLQMELPLIFYFSGLVISFACLAVEVIYVPYLTRWLNDNSRAKAIVSSIFTSATSSFMNPPDVYRVSYTVPILMNMKVVFLERVPAIARDTRLIFYTVFEYDALIAIFVTLLILAIIDFLQSRLQKRYGNNSSFIERCNLPGAMTILFGLALLGFVYQAKYNGNNTAVKKETKTIQNAFSLIGAGRERFVFPDTSMFTDEEVQSITNNHPHVNINDDHYRLIDTCKHPSRTTLSAFYEAEVLLFSEMNDINRWCHLTSIPFDPRGGPLSVPWLDDSMVTGDDYQFVTSKQMPRKAVETLNFLILSVYNYDQQSSYLLRKYVSKLELAEQILNGDADFTVNESPFSMMQLEMPLIFLALGLTASWVVFLIENLCENGTLHLGFTQEAYPKLYYKEGRIVGYIEEFWRIVLKEVGCERLQFVNYDNLLYSCTTYKCLTLLDGAVERNEVFSNIPAMYFNHADVFDYRYSMPLLWNELMLVEGRNTTDRNEDNPDLIQFTVFQYDAFTLLILLLIAIKIVAYLFSELRKFQLQKPVLFDWMELLSACIVLIGTTFAMAVYQSDFKGNAATVAVEAATSFSEMIKSMQSGARRMILEDAATFTPQERQALFGRSTTVMGDTARRIRAVCSDPRLVTMVYDQESLVMTTMSDLMDSCLLKRIAYPRENENPVDWLTRSLKGADYGQIGMPRSTPRKIVDKINEISMKLFDPDLAALRPVSFSRISIPFTIYFTIITFTMLVFIIELVASYFCQSIEMYKKKRFISISIPIRASLIILGMSLLLIVYQSEFEGNAATRAVQNTMSKWTVQPDTATRIRAACADSSVVMQIGMPRETPFKVVERINEIAMKLFNWDLAELRPVSLARLSIPFTIFLIALRAF